MLTDSSDLLVKKFNICLERYCYYISELEKELDSNQEAYLDILGYLKEQIHSKEESYKILISVMDRLNKFSTLYDVDIQNIDDFKLVYFIAYYFLADDGYCSQKKEKKIILILLHEIMCKTLLVYEPESILGKIKRFLKKESYLKFKEEYGDIGYYHMIKSIYLMQKASARLLMDKKILESENSLVATYFLGLDDA